MFRKLIIGIALTLCAISAFAIPKPSEVAAAFSAGDYSRAESMLKEVMKEKPTAKVHYQLGQVYSKQGKHDLALNEFRQAQVLDPSLKFASSAAAFTKNLADEQAIVAPPPSLRIVEQPRERVYIPPAYTAPQPQPQGESHAGAYILFLFGILLFGVVMYFVVMTYVGKRDEKNQQAAKDEATRKKRELLLDFTKRLEDALLIARASPFSDVMKEAIVDNIKNCQIQARNMLADLKDGRDVSSTRISTLESNVETAVDQSTNGIPAKTEPAIETPAPRVKSKVYQEAEPRCRVEIEKPTSVYHRPAAPPAPPPRRTTVVHNHYNTPVPAPVVVNNNDGYLSGLVSGVLIDEALSNRRETPRYETPRYEESSRPAPREEIDDNRSSSWSSTPTIDTNDSSSSWDTSSSIDSSSSDNDSY